jgi:hypothetical protein
MGFEESNMEVIFTLEKDSKAKEIEVRFLDLSDSWVFPPENVEIYALNDKNEFESLGKPSITKEKRPTGGAIVHYIIPFPQFAGGLIKIIAVNRGVCPQGHVGEGKPAWIFSDEVIVR